MSPNTDPVAGRVHGVAERLSVLLAEAEAARAARAESVASSEDEDSTGSAVCAWNHFENIPTFYNWNNRPR